MKRNPVFVLTLVVSILSTSAFSQNIAINTDGSLPDSNAILDIKSNNKGILIPRMDSARRAHLPNVEGLLVYDNQYHTFWYNNGFSWNDMSPAVNNWSVYGNKGTNSYNFIGTIDNQPFIVKMNNQLSGRVSNDSNNRISTWGYLAGYSNTTGYDNTAVGFYSLYSNTTGQGNTATGSLSLEINKIGSYNTANGYTSLMRHINGSYNTAMGYGSLSGDTSGKYNTALGSKSLFQNSLGSFNTAVGYAALYTNGTGTFNTAIGYGAKGDYTTINSTAIGYNATVNADNKVRIGNSAVTVIEGQVPFTTPSDGRFKYQVQEDVKGLAFILQLRPVTYQFDGKKFDAQLSSSTANNESLKVPDAMLASYNEAADIRRSGFIAQEVEKAATVSGYNFSGIIKPKTEHAYYSLSYEAFVVPLVKAVQEQQVLIDNLQKRLGKLEQLVIQGAKQ
jgi:hypothetical protein